MRVWTEAVRRAVLRHVAQTGSPVFTRQALFAAEDAALKEETKTLGRTPRQTGTRELQHLRDEGLLEFLSRGTYRWLGEIPALVPPTRSNAVFVLNARGDRSVFPEEGFVFALQWLAVARRSEGQWILYQDIGGYAAAARVEAIVVKEDQAGLARAGIERGSYFEFGRTVPLDVDGLVIEGDLAGSDGRLETGRAGQAIRAITPEAFERILKLALVDDDDFLPRDAAQDLIGSSVNDRPGLWLDPVDRTKILVERTVRDRQFRKRVLDAYGARCALTGMKLTNGGGRAETQAAHIKSVAANGPDSINNGIALSGTVHWMFDRGLISLSDAGDILLSRAINDRDSVERLVYRDRRARLPANRRTTAATRNICTGIGRCASTTESASAYLNILIRSGTVQHRQSLSDPLAVWSRSLRCRKARPISNAIPWITGVSIAQSAALWRQSRHPARARAGRERRPDLPRSTLQFERQLQSSSSRPRRRCARDKTTRSTRRYEAFEDTWHWNDKAEERIRPSRPQRQHQGV